LKKTRNLPATGLCLAIDTVSEFSREVQTMQKPNAEPTPEEIRLMCWEIQAEWSEAERVRRIVDDHFRAHATKRWTAPVNVRVRTSGA
jgi:hypothetical protein